MEFAMLLSLSIVLFPVWIYNFAEGALVGSPVAGLGHQVNQEGHTTPLWRYQNAGARNPYPGITHRSSRASASGQKREISYAYKPYNYRGECEHKCDDGACLPSSSYRCDGHAHCWDGTDEKGCTCEDFIPDGKKCDGVKDCPDGADEEDCVFGCLPDEFTCDLNNAGSKVKCISGTKVCDGQFDCLHKNDEHNCFRLVDLGEETRGVRSHGILQKRIGREWYTFCKTPSASHFINTFAQKACEAVVGVNDGSAKISSKSLSSVKLQMTKQSIQELRFLRLASIESKFTLLASCNTDQAYEIECPTPQCGGLGSAAEQDLRRRRRRDAAEDDEKYDDYDSIEATSEIGMIVGGQDTKDVGWPFLVGIYRNGEFYCGGSIVDEYWILTAAHCTHGFERHVYEVQAGMMRRQSWGPYEQTRDVVEIRVHEEYDNKVFANDIALFKLDKPLHLSKYVTPACLPRGSEDDPTSGQGCRVAGWGDLTESGTGPDHMQEVELPVLQKCLETFTRDTHQICAGVMEGGKDACQGDSGGPLLCINDAGTPMVSGVVSFGRGCARAFEAGAYTRVSAYLDWIDGIVTGESASTVNQRPQQCTEKCIKSGGECLHPSEKCSGTVECLGGYDELGCFHSVTRNTGEHYGNIPPPPQTQPSPYWTNYQRQGQGSSSSPAHVVSRNGASATNIRRPIGYYPPLPKLNPSAPMMSRATTFNRVGRRVVGSCEENEFKCQRIVDESQDVKECIQNTQVCDKTPNCSDNSDEIKCLAVTKDFREPLNPSQSSNGEIKGYVIIRMKDTEWNPLVLKDWTLEDGQQFCETLLPSGTLESLETVQLTEVAKRLRSSSLAEATVVTSEDTQFLRTTREAAGTGSQATERDSDSNNISKIQLTRDNVSEVGENMLLGFVRCSSNK